MIIIGIDPGTATTGYGVIKVKEKDKNKKTKGLDCLDFGCIKTSQKDEFVKRLSILSKEIKKLVKKHNPDLVAIEKLFFFQNFKTAMRVSQAIGVVFLSLGQMKVSFVEYTPLEVKKFLTNNGRADKKEVEKRVKKMLKIKGSVGRDDTADALGIAIYAAHKTKK
jgi:crossover junction endodeoxyribonuclease RuvC